MPWSKSQHTRTSQQARRILQHTSMPGDIAHLNTWRKACFYKKIQLQCVHKLFHSLLSGCLESVEWNGGMELWNWNDLLSLKSDFWGAVWNQWNGMVEWNSGMEYWNDLSSLKSDVWGCYELQHLNGSRISKCRY